MADSEKTPNKHQNIFMRMAAWYSKKLDTHPLLTKCLTNGFIAGGGDIICQAGVYNPDDHRKKDGSEASFWTDVYDIQRTFRFWFLGTFFAATTGHYWYEYLARNHAGPGFSSVFKRVFLDQYMYTPVWTVVWLSGLWTLEGAPPRDLPNGLYKYFPDVIVANWILWTPIQFANFYIIPVKYQLLFTNFVDLLWNAYLSFAAAGKDHDESDNKIEPVQVEGKAKVGEEVLQQRMTPRLPRRKTFR